MDSTKQAILALDQGTSSSRAILYDMSGAVIDSAQEAFDMSFPQDGWVEQDPEALWQTILNVVAQVLAKAQLNVENIACVGITNQRETTLIWDRKSGECIYPAIVWQDRRTAEMCEKMSTDEFQGQPLPDLISSTTGLLIDPYFSATKVAWILDNVAGARALAEAGELCFGTVDSFLVWRLSGGRSHITDASNASRTQLYDIHKGCYSSALLSYLDIPESMLPRVVDNAGPLAQVDAKWFGAELPITGMAGDQQAALVGQGCFARGMSKSTYGTGCFVMTNTGDAALQSQHQLLTTVAYQLQGKPTYALEGSIFVAGVAIKWLRDKLGLIKDVAETQEAFIATDGDSGGVFVVPAFTGLGAPYWRPHARGLITGLTLDTTREQIITAFLQGVVYQTDELLSAMARDGAEVQTLRIDGGMVVNDELCQFLADMLNVEVERPRNIETTALGAAILAGLGAGVFESLASAGSAWQLDRRFAAHITNSRRVELQKGYEAAVARAM